MAEACRLALSEMPTESTRVLALRQRLYNGLLAEVPEIVLNGHPTQRLPGNLNLSFTYVDGEALMMSMRDIAVSSGSACTSANPEPSHVLMGIGLDEDLARASLRFGIGRFNTEEEIDYAVSAVANSVANLRVHSSAWTHRDQGP
jgi:cysteine desulfurase